jgi:4-diphosphocytidyl-2-C-methyl-D-erythritol kinase
MPALRDTAWAKLNLTLEVLGRRADGFHELESLVAFAGLGDPIELEPDGALSLVVEGPFAHSLTGDNLIVKAAEAARTLRPGASLGCFRLNKILPVAAGLGGGSADAAAALRLLVRANQGVLSQADLAGLASGLGSDITVCLASRPATMTGRGERLAFVRGFPACAVLLVNPRVQLSAASVYAALDAKPLSSSGTRKAESLNFGGDFDALIDYAAPRGNDLERAASSLAPVIGDVLRALEALPDARLARLSGSGPTCFALFATLAEAEHGTARLAKAHPHWWLVASTLGNQEEAGN